MKKSDGFNHNRRLFVGGGVVAAAAVVLHGRGWDVVRLRLAALNKSMSTKQISQAAYSHRECLSR